MTLKSRIIGLTIVLVVGVLTVLAARRARHDLVTLDVQNMPLHQVVKKIEWQTWEYIEVQKDLNPLITLNVKRVPLTEVLEILAEQAEGRWSRFYPLYTVKKSFTELREVVRGDRARTNSNWKSFNAGGFGGAGGSPFANNTMTTEGVVSLNIKDQEIESGLRSLSRVSNSRVVAEDGTKGQLTLSFDQTPLENAVSTVAKQLRRSHSRFYALFGGGRPFRDVAQAPPSNEESSSESTISERPQRVDGPRGDITQRIAEFQQLSAADQQKKLTDLGVPAEFQSSLQQLAQMPAEQRGDFIQQQMQSPQIQNLIQDRALRGLAYTTPEQRAARDRRAPQRMGQNRP